MFIEVNRIPPEGLEIDRPLTLQPLTLEGASVPVAGVRLAGLFRRSRDEVVFRGSIKATVELVCSRCANGMSLEIAGDCYRVYRSGGIGRRGGEGDLNEDELALTPYDGFHIDLDELAREQVYLLLPLKPLCRETCEGLCPRCGADRNLAPCGCPPDAEGRDLLTLKIPF